MLNRAGVHADRALSFDEPPSAVLIMILAGIVTRAGCVPLWEHLAENFELVGESRHRADDRTSAWAGLFVLAFLAVAFVWVIVDASSSGRVDDSASSFVEPASSDEFANTYADSSAYESRDAARKQQTWQPPLPLPPSGTVKRYHLSDPVSPMVIDTSTGAHYFCKMSRVGDNLPIVTVFIRGGGRAEFEVPTGAYELKYAVGENWYGEEDLFGPSTARFKAAKILHCERIGDSVQGYTVELIKQVAGNLITYEIPEEDW